MPSFKATFFFQDTSGYGWSENYWVGAPLLQVIMPILVQTANLRIVFLPQDVGLNYIRLASGTARDPQFTVYSDKPGAPNGLYPANSDPDFTALKWRLDAFVGHASLFTRTVPTDSVTEDGYTPTPAFLKATSDYSSWLTGAHVGAVTFNLRSSLASGNPRVPITSLQPNIPRGFSFLAAAGSFTVGQQIRVSGAKVYGYNGLKTVVAVQPGVPNDSVLVGGAATPAPEPITSNTSARLETYQYNALETAFPEGITRRSPGRFFGARRGRRSTINSLRQ